ncbi:bifunctional ADP-dependent NAD(P)H-hydrate dehydratase/NAD(P)H-hydrate epimerase [Herminiimonas arsenitoxidans]|uniref:bifunctional ADP-dependent NAD(P)H-hydrate dehydratase/NAD(P)H-hydrate epimerase n=1 Tax=Herminiimonas arsenitoxidans TaxID=1809410 RepID=UPI0009711AEE|nr:bifunctional ADP-dependent NAD(P)H-hydrate dehydratase/NAD(P)H-hydrate epimerase [Herminiimonas arsenitoxidans]
MTDIHTLYTVADIRKIEQAALATLPSYTLMQRAGKAAAEFAYTLQQERDKAGRILVLAGPGNNGGDALEAASQLANAGLNVSIFLAANAENLPADAQQALKRAKSGKATFLETVDTAALNTTDWALVIDGLFGIGLTRAITNDTHDLIAAINTLSCQILALDVPSGLNADTGAIVGEDAGIAIQATHTITFIGNKPGLHTCEGRDHAGEVSVVDLDIAEDLFLPSRMQLSRTELFCATLRPRRHNSNKGSYGDVSILGGAHGMVGAAVLAARSATKCGAGRVFIASLAESITYDNQQAELMCRLAGNMDYESTTTVAGPGLGTSRPAHDCLTRAILANTPLVLDADALNLIAVESGLRQKLLLRHASTILTPHPLEAARLLGITTQQVQADRLAAARTLAATFHATTILKGSGTVIATPDGDIVINTTGNPALATAGSGDVLAGLCGALLAQNYPAWEAAVAAVWLHGKAADELVENGVGPIGLTASELIPEIRSILNRLVYAKPAQIN